MRIVAALCSMLSVMILLGCPALATGQTIIHRIEPTAPTVGQPVRVWLQSRAPVVFYADPVVSIDENAIRISVDVTHAISFPPAPDFRYVSANIPPLPAGTYTIELYVFLRTRPEDPPQLRDTLEFSVGLAQPEVIPASSGIALALLALMMMGVFYAFRRRLAEGH
jgi:hypothetical protein